MFGGADCGLGRRESRRFCVVCNLPNKFLSIFEPILFCNEGFLDVGIGSSEGADGNCADGRGGRGNAGSWHDGFTGVIVVEVRSGVFCCCEM